MADSERPLSFDELLGELNALRLRLNKLEMTVQAMSRGSFASQAESAHGAGASSLDDVFSVIGVLRGRLRELESAAARMRAETQDSARAGWVKMVEPSPVAPPPLPPQAPAAPAGIDAPPAEPAVPLAAQAAPAGEELQPAPLAARPTFEQRIGTRWLLIAGVIVTLLSAVFFFKYAIEQGWISPLRRVLAGAVVGLIMIGLGEWAFRRRMRFFAAGMIGGGVAMLYLVAFGNSEDSIIN